MTLIHLKKSLYHLILPVLQPPTHLVNPSLPLDHAGRLGVVVAGLLPALKRFSQPCCLWPPLSEGHIMALRRPSFLHNDYFLCSCPAWLAVWLCVCGWQAGHLTGWPLLNPHLQHYYVKNKTKHTKRSKRLKVWCCLWFCVCIMDATE